MLFGDNNSGYVDALRRSTKVSFKLGSEATRKQFRSSSQRSKDELILGKEEVN